jgi:SAM-dependent methyltransferase
LSDPRAACQSCGHAGPVWTPKYPQIQLFECSACRSMSYLPSESFDQGSLYTQAYFKDGEYGDYVGHRAAHEANAKAKWALLMPYVRSPARVFEIGCAYGFFTNYVLKSGAERAYGIDVSADAIQFARANFGPFFGLPSDPEPPDFDFNCLAAWDVWEHLLDPLDYFAAYVSRLAPGGVVAISTMDLSAAVARMRGVRWRQIHPPTHIHYPTKEGLANGMRSLGLEILEHRHIAHYRALEAYLAVLGLDKRLPSGRLADRIKTYPVRLDMMDEQIVVCRKPGTP